MSFEHGRLQVLRPAPRPPRTAISFGIWMALARATPVAGLDEGSQPLLAACNDSAAGC